MYNTIVGAFPLPNFICEPRRPTVWTKKNIKPPKCHPRILDACNSVTALLYFKAFFCKVSSISQVPFLSTIAVKWVGWRRWRVVSCRLLMGNLPLLIPKCLLLRIACRSSPCVPSQSGAVPERSAFEWTAVSRCSHPHHWHKPSITWQRAISLLRSVISKNAQPLRVV